MSSTELGTVVKRPGVGIAVIITDKLYPNCVILGKRKGSIGSGLFQLPGGHLEFGESWEKAAHREVEEETGLRLQNVCYCHVVNTVKTEQGYHYVTVFMKGEVDHSGPAEPQNLEPEKNEGWQWVNWESLPPFDSLFWALQDFVKAEIDPFNP